MAERNYLFDNFKALLIFCVVFAHFLRVSGHYELGSPSRIIYIICFTFMMEGFFFISGYFSRNVDKCRAKAVETFLLPYVVFMILCFCARYVIFGTAHLQLVHPTHALWFLLVMFYYRFGIKTLIKVPFVLPLSAVLFLASGAIPMFGPVMSMQRACAFLVFFMLGYYCKWEYIEAIRKIPRPLMLLPMALLVGLSVWCANQQQFRAELILFRHNNDTLDLSFAEAVAIRFIFGLAALMWLAVWFNLMPNRKLFRGRGLITEIGQNTMTVFLLHIFVRLVLKWAGRQDFVLLSHGGLIYVGIILVMALACVYVFSRPVIAKAYDKAMHFLYKPFGKAFEFVVKLSHELQS